MARHQQTGIAQHVKQGIAPDAQTPFLQRRLQQVMELARAQARLAQPLVAHQLHHGLGAIGARRFTPQALVVRLAADAPMPAGPLHAQLREEFLRKDLPKGFFTTTP